MKARRVSSARLGLYFIAAVWLIVIVPLSAMAAPYAAYVMDARTGKVIHARNADTRLHPASLTKMMTLYIAFDMVKRGKLRLGQKLRVSRHASRMPASKLYLKAGQRVTVQSLIHATAIKSANDAAMVLAEGIGGSQAAFARMMTRQAKRLGMKNTRFKNPHGLTQRGHYSTARDMAILARHLFHDFPEFYHIFKRTRGHAAGKRIWSTNRLLSSYRGADGIKTGYTRAAGYNLVASAHRGKKRVIAVAMGERSSRVRNRRVRELLDLGFRKAAGSVRTVRPRTLGGPTRSVSRKGRILVRNAPVPAHRPGSRITVADAVAEVLAVKPAAAATLHRGETARKRNGSSSKASAKRLMANTSHAPRMAALPVPRKSIRVAKDSKADIAVAVATKAAVAKALVAVPPVKSLTRAPGVSKGSSDLVGVVTPKPRAGPAADGRVAPTKPPVPVLPNGVEVPLPTSRPTKLARG